MTWTLAAFTILFLALAAGFAWYERAQPTSRILALVATLAALAALGRIAFAPLPNIKPTTDIVLLAGFALGAAPGFAVGATAALTSNLFFGQGPWTPWQMVGWGLCGLLGAALARITRGEPSRLQLALACALAGAVYGVLLDVHDWLVYAPEQSASQYVLVAGVSLPFNLAHIAGNVVFAATLGPALLRILTRFKARCEIDWRPLAPAAAALLAALVVLGNAAPPAQASVASDALGFLQRAQNRDGGWGQARGAASTPLYSAWALVGQGAARDGRCDAAGVRYVQRHTVQATGDVERTILALRACRRGTGSLDRRLRARQGKDGSFNGLTNLTSFGVFALRAGGLSARNSRLRRAAAFIARQQNHDGGFSYARRGSGSGVDDTAAAVQALVAAGRSRTRGPVARAVQFLRVSQRADGGFGATRRLSSNAQSTSWAVQAFVAAGVDPDRVRRGGSRSTTAYLRSLASPDGSVRYSRTSRQTPVWVTGQALAALARKSLPIR
jgi:energy-coupling factor transport system substrate-specific component